MMNADVTAENRPACNSSQGVGPVVEQCARLTNMRVVLRSSSCFFMNSLSYSSASFRYSV